LQNFVKLCVKIHPRTYPLYVRSEILAAVCIKFTHSEIWFCVILVSGYQRVGGSRNLHPHSG
jgi:hypothetical protein